MKHGKGSGMGAEVPKLRRLCRRWGGDLRCVTSDEFEQLKQTRAFYEAPFTHRDIGVIWSRKLVVYAGEIAWVEAIHEMGHVFASRMNPDHANELLFLGWEIAMVDHIKGDFPTWLAGNKEYETTKNGGQSLGDMSPNERDNLFAERLVIAREAGILGLRNRPLAIR